jgi:hypothetical protein
VTSGTTTGSPGSGGGHLEEVVSEQDVGSLTVPRRSETLVELHPVERSLQMARGSV